MASRVYPSGAARATYCVPTRLLVPGPVFHHDPLAESLVHLLRQRARVEIEIASRSKRHDDAHRLGRVLLCAHYRRYRRRQRCGQQHQR
jgi:hypothetical protein